MIYLVDIDGTVADLTHRLHFIQDKPADWNAFFAACPSDKPIPEVIEVIRAVGSGGHELHMLTGRSESVRYGTGVWLHNQFIPFRSLRMRKEGDHREDAIVKSEMLDTLLTDLHISLSDIAGVFEDRQQVVDMYRARGLRVFQVAEGKF